MQLTKYHYLWSACNAQHGTYGRGVPLLIPYALQPLQRKFSSTNIGGECSSIAPKSASILLTRVDSASRSNLLTNCFMTTNSLRLLMPNCCTLEQPSCSPHNPFTNLRTPESTHTESCPTSPHSQSTHKHLPMLLTYTMHDEFARTTVNIHYRRIGSWIIVY